MTTTLDNLFKLKHVIPKPFNDHLKVYFDPTEKTFDCSWADPPTKSLDNIKGHVIVSVTEKLDHIRLYSWGTDRFYWYPDIPECWIYLYTLDMFFKYFKMDKDIVYVKRFQRPFKIEHKGTLIAIAYNPVDLTIPQPLVVPLTHSVIPITIKHSRSQDQAQDKFNQDWIKDLVC